MNLFTRNSPYYPLLKYLLFLLKQPLCIYIYICMCVYIYIYMYVCVCVYIYIYSIICRIHRFCCLAYSLRVLHIRYQSPLFKLIKYKIVLFDEVYTLLHFSRRKCTGFKDSRRHKSLQEHFDCIQLRPMCLSSYSDNMLRYLTARTVQVADVI